MNSPALHTAGKQRLRFGWHGAVRLAPAAAETVWPARSSAPPCERPTGEPGSTSFDEDPVDVDGVGPLGPEPDFAAMSFSALDTELGALCRHGNAIDYRRLVMIAELERRNAWSKQGFLSAAHYLNWRCGISLGPAREQVRTVLALGALPLISQQLRCGRLSYSKVRALTRIATADNEAHLRRIALGSTASHVERHVRRRRQAQAAGNPALLYRSRSCRRYWDDDGMYVLYARMPADQGALCDKALGRGVQDIGAFPASDVGDADEQRAAVHCDALARVFEGFLAHKGGSGHAADRFMVHVDVCAATLAASTADEVAPEALATLQDDGPPLSMAMLQRLSCDASIVVHAQPQRKAGDVIEAAEVIEPVETVEAAQTIEALHAKPPAAPEPASKPADPPRRTRTVPASLRREVQRRDGGCRFPGCIHTRFVDVHHVVHWAQGGETTHGNLDSLCRHHHVQVHELGYRIVVADDPVNKDGIRFRFFNGDDGTEIAAAGDG